MNNIKTLITKTLVVCLLLGQTQGQVKVLLQSPINEGVYTVATTLEIFLAPGDVGADPHVHPGPAIGFVIEGEYLLQIDRTQPQVITPGTCFTIPKGAVHAWGANASNSTTCQVFAIVYGKVGEPVLDFVQNYTRDEFSDVWHKAKRHVVPSAFAQMHQDNNSVIVLSPNAYFYIVNFILVRILVK